MALPAVLAGDVRNATGKMTFSCSRVVIILAVVPWRYAWQRYAIAQGDRWR